MNVCVPCLVAREVRRRHVIPCNWTYRWFWECSARLSTLHSWAISPVPYSGSLRTPLNLELWNRVKIVLTVAAQPVIPAPRSLGRSGVQDKPWPAWATLSSNKQIWYHDTMNWSKTVIIKNTSIMGGDAVQLEESLLTYVKSSIWALVLREIQYSGYVYNLSTWNKKQDKFVTPGCLASLKTAWAMWQSVPSPSKS